MAKSSITHAKSYFRVCGSSMCPNLYWEDRYSGFLGSNRTQIYFCSATNKDLDSGYVNEVCQKPKHQTECTWSRHNYPSPR